MIVSEKDFVEFGENVYITDFLSKKDLLNKDFENNLKSGKWQIQYEYNEYEDGMSQEITVKMCNIEDIEDIFSSKYEDMENSFFGIKGGILSVCDKEHYNKYFNNKNNKNKWFKKNVLDNIKEKRRGINLIENKGFWVNCSYIDGFGFCTATMYVKNDKICGIILDI